MKRSFNQIALIAALLLTLGVSTSFAANTTDNGGVTASFRKDFKQAELLSTDAGKDYTKITFKINGAILSAFYSQNGELLAITHNIRPTDLPINLLMQIKSEHADCWITDCFEFDANGSTSYFITLENSDNKLTLHSNGADWETYSRILK
ncbi:MAG TPA: hypothetical protein VHW43_14105 [Puia sp.]|jgi:hypothetical protein|nr:hypothetical protein [Puia sp.]